MELRKILSLAILMTISVVNIIPNVLKNLAEDKCNSPESQMRASVNLCQPFLSPKSNSSQRITLVLDLDETLVHSTANRVQFPRHCFPTIDLGTGTKPFSTQCRPHLKYFLAEASKKFEIVVFTASNMAYAAPILDTIDPDGNLIQYRLYRDSCHMNNGTYVKDLRVLGRNLSEVVIVDNSPLAFGFQVENGIPIKSWIDDSMDEELLYLLQYLDKLHYVDDVRPLIARHFEQFTSGTSLRRPANSA